MFPNLRLLLASLFVSLMTLSFGFGVFATFGVQREPLNRLPAQAAPLQLVSEDPPQGNSANAWGAPFGARLTPVRAEVESVDAAPSPGPISRGAEAPAPSVIEFHGAAAGVANPDAETTGAIAAVNPPAPAIQSPPIEQAPAAANAGESAPQPAPPALSDNAGTPGPAAAKPPAPAAIAPVAAIEPAEAAAPIAEQPEQATNSTPEPGAPGAEAVPVKAHGKTPAKILRRAVRRPAKRPRRAAVARRPFFASRPARIASRTRDLDNPIFISAPRSQRPATRSPVVRRTAKRTFHPLGTMER